MFSDDETKQRRSGGRVGIAKDQWQGEGVWSVGCQGMHRKSTSHRTVGEATSLPKSRLSHKEKRRYKGGEALSSPKGLWKSHKRRWRHKSAREDILGCPRGVREQPEGRKVGTSAPRSINKEGRVFDVGLRRAGGETTLAEVVVIEEKPSWVATA